MRGGGGGGQKKNILKHYAECLGEIFLVSKRETFKQNDKKKSGQQQQNPCIRRRLPLCAQCVGGSIYI
jgi:hypothetical protein